MIRRFKNRVDAGRRLADALGPLIGTEEVVVTALPRGGIPVGAEVAHALGAPLKVFVVRKLGVPGHEEYAMGAVASGGIILLNHAVVERLGLTSLDVHKVISREQGELERREASYGGPLYGIGITGKTVILVDDGIATGSTVKVAIQALRLADPARIVVAVPVAPASARDEFESLADLFVAVIEPYDFYAVGQWYDDFTQTSDEEVHAILKQFETELAHPGGHGGNHGTHQ